MGNSGDSASESTVCTSEPQTIRRIPGAVHRRFGCRCSSRFGAAGFPPECAGSLATLSLAAMRGLQLDRSLPASERASTRYSVAHRMRVLDEAARKKHRSTAVAGLEEDGQRTIVGGPAGQRGVAIDDWGTTGGHKLAGRPPSSKYARVLVRDAKERRDSFVNGGIAH